MTIDKKVDIESLSVGDLLPEREHAADNVLLFLYNAVLFNAHRIHFDYPYATQVEGYSGLVTAGPLIGDWLHQCVEEWVGEAGLLSMVEYSNRLASYSGETLYAGGEVVEIDRDNGEISLRLFVKNQRGEVVAPGQATVRLFDTDGGSTSQ